MSTVSAQKNLYSIPAREPFFKVLIDYCWQMAGNDFGALSDQLILLPSRRACRELREEFLRFFDGQPILPPRMNALGDLDEDDIALLSYGQDTAEQFMEIPPAISPIKRQMILADKILNHAKQDEKGGIATRYDQAMVIAGQLGRFIDEMITEGAVFDDLKNIVPENYASHWDVILSFLSILFDEWPSILTELGYVDPATRRNMVIRAQAQLWAHKPPSHPVIIAGVTGTIPAAAELIKTVLSHDNGHVILPGVDMNIDAESYAVLGEDHPQHGFKELLQQIEIKRENIEILGLSDGGARAVFLGEVMRPKETTDRWSDLSAERFQNALASVKHIEFENEQDEAQAIALMLREVLEAPAKTACLVTADRHLARRVSSLMKRWDVQIDDSGGVPLHQTPLGIWFLLLAEMIESDCDPVLLVAFLKHPLTHLGMDKKEMMKKVHAFEKHLLRAGFSGQGLDEIMAFTLLDERTGEPRDLPDISFIQNLKEKVQDFVFKLKSEEKSLKEIALTHVRLAEELAASDHQTGAEILWVDDDGEAMAHFFSNLLQTFDEIHREEHVSNHDFEYSRLLQSLMMGVNVRPKFGGHPRLKILGLMEARLINADVFILGGLNENVWPPEPTADPFLSRGMRIEAGLPTHDKAIGMAAHDFVEKLSKPQVILTRALKSGGSPTIASRWLVRMKALCEKLGIHYDENTSYHDWLYHWHLSDRDITPIKRPMPRPSVDVRPTRLSVSSIEKLMRDPYVVYAQKVLNVQPLDPLKKKSDAAARGQFLHKVMEEFCELYPDDMDEHAREHLDDIAARLLPEFCPHEKTRVFWKSRFDAIAPLIIAHEREWRTKAQTLVIEREGTHEFIHDKGTFTLYARADRMDINRQDKAVTIIDYKTGGIPSDKDVTHGFSPQLPLEALIANKGGFGPGARNPVASLEYWALKKGEQKKFVKAVKADIDELIDEAEAGLLKLVTYFADESVPYPPAPRQDKALAYNDFEHLSRQKEWGSGTS